MTSNSPALGVLADPATGTGTHYGAAFYAALVIVAIAALIVFFAVVRFVLKRIDRRSRG